jgi:hypothetical protein
MLDFEVQHCTRHCAVSGQQLQPGEEYYAVLRKSGGNVLREDYSVAAWQGPPADCLAWWKAKLPLPNSANKPHWAPNDVMLQLFEQLGERPDQADMRYVLSLLLIRRRLLRLEDSQRDAMGIEQLKLYCPRNEVEYQIPAILPDDNRVKDIQNELAKLLFSSSE